MTGASGFNLEATDSRINITGSGHTVTLNAGASLVIEDTGAIDFALFDTLQFISGTSNLEGNFTGLSITGGTVNISGNISGSGVIVSGGTVNIYNTGGFHIPNLTPTTIVNQDGGVVSGTGFNIIISGGINHLTGNTVSVTGGTNTISGNQINITGGSQYVNTVSGTAYITGQNIYVTGVSHVTGSIVTVSGGTSFVTGQTILITGETVVTNITGGIFNNTSGNLYVTGQDNTFNIDESINLINSTGGQWHFTGGTNRTTINTSGENTFSGYIDTINYFPNNAVTVDGNIVVSGVTNANLSGQNISITGGTNTYTGDRLKALRSDPPAPAREGPAGGGAGGILSACWAFVSCYGGPAASRTVWGRASLMTPCLQLPDRHRAWL